MKILLMVLCLSIPAMAQETKVTGSRLANPLTVGDITATAYHGDGSSLSNILTAASTITFTAPITFSNDLIYTPPTSYGLGRNRIINGNMDFDQKLEGISAYDTTGKGAYYSLDMWRYEGTGAANFSVTQVNHDSIPMPPGFTHAMQVLGYSPAVTGATDGNNMEYPAEPSIQKDWEWGTANAKTVTLSFWTLASSSGNYSVSLLNGVNSKSYNSVYNIPVANTWTYITKTIPGEKTGGYAVWPTSGPVFGLKVVWDLGSCAAVTTATTDTWHAGSYWRSAGTVGVTEGAGVAWYLTGVQLEIGTHATPYEYVDNATALKQVQRYYFKTFPRGTPVGTSKGWAGTVKYVTQVAGTAAGYGLSYKFPVEMFVTPGLTFYNLGAANDKWRTGGAVDSASGSNLGGFADSPNEVLIYNPQVVGDGAGQILGIHFTANSRLGGG